MRRYPESSVKTMKEIIIAIIVWSAAFGLVRYAWRHFFAQSSKKKDQAHLLGFAMSWTIADFTWDLIENWVSPVLEVGSCRWSMELESINPKKYATEQTLSLNVTNLEKDTEIKYRLSAVNRDGEKIFISKAAKTVHSRRDKQKIVDFSSVDEKLKEELITEDSITFLLEVVFRSPANQLAKLSDALPDTTPTRDQSPSKSLITDLENLFATEQLSDLIVHIGDERIKAHKAVFVARCPFIASFYQDGSSEITLKDIDPQIAADLFRFLYTGTIPQKCIDEHGESILQAAHALEIDELKSIAEENLCQSVTVENSSRRLILAHKCSSRKVRESTIDFISSHWKSFEASEGYHDLEPYPKILIELLKSKKSDL